LRAESTFPVVTRAQLGIVLLIGAVLLAGTCVLVFGPARGARNDIGQVRTDLTVSRRGIFSALADATVQLHLAEQSLQIQQQGLGIAKDSQHVAHLAADDTEAIRVQTEQALTTVRDVLAAVGPISELKGSLGTVVKQVEAGVSLARTALAVAQQTLATGQAALAVAVSTLDALHASLDVQRQLLDVARQTLEQAKEINRKIPGLPVFPSATGAP
jgi:hypothetical protein